MSASSRWILLSAVLSQLFTLNALSDAKIIKRSLSAQVVKSEPGNDLCLFWHISFTLPFALFWVPNQTSHNSLARKSEIMFCGIGDSLECLWGDSNSTVNIFFLNIFIFPTIQHFSIDTKWFLSRLIVAFMQAHFIFMSVWWEIPTWCQSFMLEEWKEREKISITTKKCRKGPSTRLKYFKPKLAPFNPQSGISVS